MPKLPSLTIDPPNTPTLHTTPQAAPLRPLALRLKALTGLLGMVRPVVATVRYNANGGSTDPNTTEGGSNGLTLKSCESYSELKGAWRKALNWSRGLDNALVAMLSSSMSTEFVGEQLWLKIIGPPSSGKTTIMEGLATAKKWYLSKDTIRGFHSGWKREDHKDVSLAQMCMGMTLGTKDGDTLLKTPNLTQILSEARALYDRVSRTNYRNDVNREYTGHRMTWHLAGTSSLREIDDSELGARFLDVVVMDKIEDEFEDEVGLRAAQREFRNMRTISSGAPESQHPEDLANAMALSGGYLDHLRSNAQELAGGIEEPDYEVSLVMRKLGKFVANMRARPGATAENTDREFSPRLVAQFSRMAYAMAIVLNKDVVDEACVARVKSIALDTSRGVTMDIMKIMVDMPQGVEIRGLAARMHYNEDKLRKYLRFLRRLSITETDSNQKRWRVTPKVVKLYREVVDA